MGTLSATLTKVSADTTSTYRQFWGTRALKERVKKLINLALVNHYGRVPSASVVAREFNFRSPSLDPITQETARRWMRGLSIPEFHRLEPLCAWLRIDLRELTSNGERSSADIEPIREARDETQVELLQHFSQLEAKHQSLVLLLARSLAEARRL
jgi:transcriptional regulator with XRE-family HTH domain